MKTEDFKDLIRPIVYKYGSGWLLDKPEMLEEICKKYHSEQLLIHSVVVSKGTLCEWKSHNYEVINIGMCGKCNGMSEIN